MKCREPSELLCAAMFLHPRRLPGRYWSPEIEVYPEPAIRGLAAKSVRENISTDQYSRTHLFRAPRDAAAFM